MKHTSSALLKEILVSTLISTAIFVVVGLSLKLLMPGFLDVGNPENHDLLSLIASWIGTSYILAVRNPNNYFAILLGIVMAVLLSWQFYLQHFYDLAILYLFVFVPCQVLTFSIWLKNSKKSETEPFNPSFLSLKGLVVMLLVFVVLFCADIFLLPHEGSCLVVAMSAIIVATSVLCNVLIIKKKTDTWYLWVLYSLAGLVQFSVSAIWPTFILYIVFFIVNTAVCVSWIRQTPKENYGWLKPLFNQKKP
ncbi:MAG: nicotinamide mononucleotide transporter [Bacteroidales bacterium]|nr:nicotinamide mononucleotide transporter [Bacteroidales bacterium]